MEFLDFFGKSLHHVSAIAILKSLTEENEMQANAIAKFVKSGHWTKVSELEIMSDSGCFVEERRYIVFSKGPNLELREHLYQGVDAKRRAMEQFEFTKSVIELNVD
jgi:hypothetical protein